MFAGRTKFIIGGIFILAAIIYLIISSTKDSIEYFITVDELMAGKQTLVGKSLRLSGAVVGETITYDPDSLTLLFEIAHVSGSNTEIEDQGGLAQVLHEAVVDPSRSRVMVSYSGIKPDLLQDEAQAIVTGQIGEDGIFYADELLLKCPTRYEGAIPEQVKDH
jgi:cytochrome c-type biogenesis protein CcmE